MIFVNNNTLIGVSRCIYRIFCRNLQANRFKMDIKEAVKGIIPKLSYDSHKGQSGRIGIVGGSRIYTGAPYFAAYSGLLVGCDLAHVFCAGSAATPIKSYSPELIVHPILEDGDFEEKMRDILPSLHSIVIGPGLGREPAAFRAVEQLIPLAIQSNLPIVLDADALFFLQSSLSIIKSYRRAILTPNKMEFIRLWNADNPTQALGTATELFPSHVQLLASNLGMVTILLKGQMDIVSDGLHTETIHELGSPRRCSGQGDLLSGSLGVFNYWAHRKFKMSDENKNPTILAAAAASMLTKKCNNLAFQKFKRATTTTNMIEEIHNAFPILFGEPKIE